MTFREKEIFNLIKDNPSISQSEIANKLNITRSSVAVHIANLMKKGYLVGKGYILNDLPYIIGIGGANIDIQGLSSNKIKLYDSNPGKIQFSCGGVGRNICENLSRIGVLTKFITCVGDDFFGKKILSDCINANIDMENSFIIKDANTSCYMSLIDSDGDMKAAISHMNIMKLLNTDKLISKHGIINKANIIVIDSNLTEDVIKYITDKYKDKIIFADAVSTKKAVKLKNFLHNIDTLKPNIYEAQIFSGMEIKTKEDLEESAKAIINKGVKNLFISMGANGVFYMNSDMNSKYYKPPKVNVVNATGAGDSMMAGLIYGRFKGLDIDSTIKFAMSMASYTIENKDTINKSISEDKVLNRMRGI